MDTDTYEQIRLTLSLIADKAAASFKSDIDLMFADHSARGRLQSGATVQAGLRIIEKSGEALIGLAAKRISAISLESDAFALFDKQIETHIGLMASKLEDVLKVAGAGRDTVSLLGARTEGLRQFEALRSTLLRQVQMHKFTFTGTPIDTPSNALTPAPNKGGKPLAKHWNRLWAHIAARLYNGDLKPESQADIERAMHDWCTGNSIDIGESTIRGRARVLWTEIQAVP